MNCKKCGTSLSEDARFCTECGAVIEAAGAETAAAAEAEPEKKNTEENGREIVFSSEDAEPEVSAAAAESEKTEPVSAEPDDKKNAEEIMPDVTLEPASEKAEPKSDTPVKVGAGRIFGASLVSILAILFLTVTGLLLSAKIGLNGAVLRNRAKEANISAVLDSEANDGITAAEYIYNNLGSALMSDKGIEVKDLRSFLIKADFGSFAGEAIEAYADYIIDGAKGDPSSSSDDFTEFFRENKEISDKEFRYEMTDMDYKNMSVRLQNRGLDDALSVDSWSRELGFSVGNLSYAFSFITLGIVAAAVLFMFVWIAIIVDKRGRHITGFYGNITLISGIIMFLPSAVFLAAASPFALATNSLAAFAAAELLVPFALVALCTGAFEIILAVIFKIIRRSSAKKEISASVH